MHQIENAYILVSQLVELFWDTFEDRDMNFSQNVIELFVIIVTKDDLNKNVA